MNAESVLIKLLRTIVLKKTPNSKMQNTLTVVQLGEVYELSMRQDIAHLLAYVLEQWGFSNIPAQILNAKSQAIYRYMRLENELQQICRTLEKAGIPFVPLKGAQIRKYYPEPWMRTSCDIDILVHKEDLDAAVSCLVKRLSYTTDGKIRFHDTYLYSPSGVHLELHFSIQENMDNIDPVLSEVWEHVRPVTEYQYEMESEFFAFHQIAHMSYHFSHGGCGVRPFLDLFLLKSQNAYDEDVLLRKYICRCGLERFYHCVTALMDVWFQDGEHSEITKQMEQYLLTGGIYGSKEYSVAIAQKKKGGKLGFLLYRIFMPYRELKIKYPVVGKYPILVPFFQVKRWWEFLAGDRKKAVLAEFEINRHSDKETVECLSCFLNKIGL